MRTQPAQGQNTITTPAGATLTCTANPINAVAGVATFAGCKIDTAGTYTLTTAASAGFTIFDPAAKLAVTTSPSASTAVNTNFATQPVVTVQDVNGYTVTNSTASVTLTITTPAGANLICTANPKNAVAGVDTVAGCRIDKAGTYTLTAAASSLTSGFSGGFTITAGTATKLNLSTGPSNSTSGTAFGTQPVAKVQDASGNTVTTSSAPVTLNITTPAGATLTCTAKPHQCRRGCSNLRRLQDRQGGELHPDRRLHRAQQCGQCQLQHRRRIGHQARLQYLSDRYSDQHCLRRTACGRHPGRRWQYGDHQ